MDNFGIAVHRREVANQIGPICWTIGAEQPKLDWRRGQTSDHWLEVAKLKWEPEFYRYVRDSFAPVGLSIQFWDEQAATAQKLRLPIVLTNDLDQPWSGPVTLRVQHGPGRVLTLRQSAHLEPLGKTTLVFDLAWPNQPGACTLQAELRGADGRPVHSVRELRLVHKPDTTSH